MAKWRHSFYKLVPSWLSTGDGEKVLFSLGMITDAIIEHGRRSLVARFPTYVGSTGLKMLGEERGILQGRGESNAGFARRLREWRGIRGHLVRGNAFAMLRQVWQYFGFIECQEIDTGGNVYTIDADGIESATHGGAWDWDGDSSWWRFWLALYPTDPTFIVQDADGADVPGAALGMSGMSAADADVVRNLFAGEHPWNAGGTRPEWLIVATDGTTIEPDGTWGNWSKNVGGTQVQARDSSARYVALRSANLDYAGDPTNYPTLITEPSGATYAGDQTNYPATLTLPGGATYAGDETNYPETIRLTDDGKAMTT